MEIRVDDLGTFVGSRGYHFEVGFVLRILAPRLANGVAEERWHDTVKAWLIHAYCTSRHRYMLTVTKLGTRSSTPSETNGLACVRRQASIVIDRAKVVLEWKKEKERDLERERERA